jgi:hypothetical protein
VEFLCHAPSSFLFDLSAGQPLEKFNSAPKFPSESPKINSTPLQWLPNSFRRAQFQYISAERNSSLGCFLPSRGSHSFEQIPCRCEIKCALQRHTQHTLDKFKSRALNKHSIHRSEAFEREMHPTHPHSHSTRRRHRRRQLPPGGLHTQRRAPPALPVQSRRLFVCLSVCVCW